MKKHGWVSWLFAGLGAALLVGALALALNTRKFIASADRAQGTVVEMIPVRDKDDGSMTYKPVVEYTSKRGQKITFTSSFSSNPPSYSVGETVDVLYAPDEPLDARIDGFGSLWLGPLILSFIGAIFATIGLAILLISRARQKRNAWLMAYGNAVQTDYQGVERNTSLKVNGRSPWRITSQWINPETSRLHVFHSENLWFDPAPHIKTQQLTVLLDPKNVKRYHMDISFLPKLAD